MTASDVVVLLLVLGFLALYATFWLRTLFDIRRSDLDSPTRGLWTLGIIFFQFLGPMAWWWVGPGARHRGL